MGTPLYSTDIKTVPNRPELSALDAGDFYLVYDTSTGKISRINKTNAHAELEKLANKKSTLSENSEIYYPNQKAVNDGLATKITRPTSTDKAIPRFSGTSGDLQNSGVTIDDSGNITPTGIYLGGTSSANLLDDYEEGSWTPVLSTAWQSFPTEIASSRGKYIKIGNIVVCHFEIEFNTPSVAVVIDDRAIITSLPFVVDLWGANDGSGRGIIYNDTGGGSNAFFDVLMSYSTEALVYCTHIDGAPNYSARFLTGHFTYYTL